MAEATFLAPFSITLFSLFIVQCLSSSHLIHASKFPSSTGDDLNIEFANKQHIQVGMESLLAQSRTRAFKNYVLGTRNRSTLQSFILSLLLLSGDININPGPCTYPCGICNKPVKSNQRGIQCDFCDFWYHIRCMNMNSIVYDALANTSCVWECTKCGLPNFSSSLLDSFVDISSQNRFSPLNDSFANDPLGEISLPDHPVCASSPTQPPQPSSSYDPEINPVRKPKKTSPYKLKCMEINCNSIVSTERAAVFKAHVDLHKPDIIFGSESKLSPDMPTNASFPQEYTVYRKERESAGGGGVFLAIKSDIVSIDQPELSADTNDEFIWASVKLARAKELFLCSLYKSPSTTVSCIDNLAELIGNIFQKSRNGCPNIVISGDFNLGDIDWAAEPPVPSNPQTAAASDTLLSFLDDYALTQSVTEATRPASGKTLDLVISSTPSLVSSIQICPGMSDHDIVIFYINARPTRSPKRPHKVHLYKRMDLDGLKHEANIICNEFFSTNPHQCPVNVNWNLFKDRLNAAIDMFVPHKLTKSKPNLPWLTKSIKRHMRKRDRLHSLAKHKNTITAKAAYRKQRNKVVALLRSSHTNYLCNEIGESLSSNPKRFWGYIKQCKTENMEIPTLRSNGVLHISDKDKAQALNNQFKSAFTEDDGSRPDCGSSPFPSISPLTFDVTGVKKQLTDLNVSKASGPDNLPPRILSALADELAPVLTFIFQQSYDTNHLPDDWLRALITPVHKKADKTNPANYRPISLTCICCKVMEHIVLSHLNKHLSAHDVLYKNQHGFRQKLSCETQLLSAIHEWATILNDQGLVDVILLDFSKAFDKVSHPKLIEKLSFYGIQGPTLAWIKAFLSSRSQVVSVNGQHSSLCNVLSGVPQGSVLGPTLFLIYINDIAEGISSTVKLFADDTIIYRKITSVEDQNILQKDLDKLVEWSARWQMEFNPSKCHHLPITNKRTPICSSYLMHGKTLDKVSSKDYLGVTQASDLRWGKHCEKIASKSNKTLGLIRRTLKVCTPEVKERAYEALVRPKLEYASSAWNPHTNRDVNKLEQVQKRAARFVHNNYKSSTSSSKLVEELGWDSLENRRLMHQVSMFYKIKNGLVNIPLPACIMQSPRSCKPHAYLQPFVKVLAFGYSPFIRSIRVWNILPEQIVTAPNLKLFQELVLPEIRTLSPPAHLKRF